MATPKSKVNKVRVTGPLAPYTEDFKARLSELGYSSLTTVNEIRLMAWLSRWLQSEGFTCDELTDERLERFVDEWTSGGKYTSCTLRVLMPLLELLRDLQAIPPAQTKTAKQNSADDMLLASFRTYLLCERGIAASTASAYVLRVSRFLTRDVPGRDLVELRACDVTAAVLAESKTVSVGAVQFFTCALRSFLRFCFLEGLIPVDLSAAALHMTGRRQSSLPKGINEASAKALLKSCDRRTSEGRRDYAIILMLLRLGLRAGEVSGLVLEDIDWRAGLVVLRGKGRRLDQLPLPADVGDAIAAYLRQGRPVTSLREVFLRSIAPIAVLGRGGVGSVVRRACVRAGIPKIGPHRLRHTAACEMVKAGVPLAEIGQVLRHSDALSTAIYARLDVEALRDLAMPWPGGGQ